MFWKKLNLTIYLLLPLTNAGRASSLEEVESAVDKTKKSEKSKSDGTGSGGGGGSLEALDGDKSVSIY